MDCGLFEKQDVRFLSGWFGRELSSNIAWCRSGFTVVAGIEEAFFENERILSHEEITRMQSMHRVRLLPIIILRSFRKDSRCWQQRCCGTVD